MPERLKDLLAAHRILMSGLIDEAAVYRHSGVGVMAGQQVIDMASPADRALHLMADLFGWLAATDAHPLIASSVFHCEFEFIHPFTNGRTGRLNVAETPPKICCFLFKQREPPQSTSRKAPIRLLPSEKGWFLMTK